MPVLELRNEGYLQKMQLLPRNGAHLLRIDQQLCLYRRQDLYQYVDEIVEIQEFLLKNDDQNNELCCLAITILIKDLYWHEMKYPEL